MSELSRRDDALLDRIEREIVPYFIREVNPANPLVADKTKADWPGEYRGHRPRPCRLPDRRRAWAHHPGRSAGPDGSRPAILRVQRAGQGGRRPLGTRGSVTLGPTRGADAEPGAASCPPSTRRCCSPGRRPARCTSIATRKTSTRFVALPTRSIAASIGKAPVTNGWMPERGFLPYRWEVYDEAMIL